VTGAKVVPGVWNGAEQSSDGASGASDGASNGTPTPSQAAFRGALYMHLRYSTSGEASRSPANPAYGSDVASRLPASTGATIS
jgi:hypothetical protein